MPRRTGPCLFRASFRPGIGSIDFHPKVTFFVGGNGSGKSTVLEVLALRLARGVPNPFDGHFLRAFLNNHPRRLEQPLGDDPDS